MSYIKINIERSALNLGCSVESVKKPIFLVLVLLLFVVGCKRDDDELTYFNSSIIVLGHQGMGEDYSKPGNTLESISPALTSGMDGCELDVQMTRDSVMVFFHDHLLEESTNCSGRIYERDWAQLCDCEYKDAEGVYINRIETVFDQIVDLQQYYFSFDLGKMDKDVVSWDTYRDQYLRGVQRICETYDMSDRIFLEAEDAVLCRGLELGLTNKMFILGLLDSTVVNYCTAHGFYGISTTPAWIRTSVDHAHQSGLRVMIFSPDNRNQNKKAINLGADIIQTDDPESLLKLLNRGNN